MPATATITPTRSVSPTPAPRSPTATWTAAPAGDELSEVQVHPKTFTPSGAAFKRLTILFRSRLAAADIQVKIFDLSGRVIARPLVTPAGGGYQASWDGKREDGQEAPAGIYFYSIQAGGAAYRGAAVLAR